MPHPTINIIAALGKRTRAIGRANKLLWHLPGDLPRFKRITSNHPVIMGRKTYESIGRPLPNRTNIVITRNRDLVIEGCVVVHTLDEALDLAKSKDNEEVFIIGGGEIYAQALTSVDRLYLTIVEDDTEGDASFPEYEHIFTKEIEREDLEHEGLRYSFIVLEKL